MLLKMVRIIQIFFFSQRNDLMNLLKAYHHYLTKYPLLTKSLSGGVLFSFADVLTQLNEQRMSKKNHQPQHKYDPIRTLRYFALGGFIITPPMHVWYTYGIPAITRRLGSAGTKQTSKAVQVAQSVFIDQTIATFATLSFYFIAINYLEHGSLSKGIDKIRTDMWPTLITNWKLWPAVQVINFWFIPIEYRVLWVNFFNVFWQVYLNQVQHKDQNLNVNTA